MNFDLFLEMIMLEYKNACEKHPHFVYDFVDKTLDELEVHETILKKYNDTHKNTSLSVIKEELCEAFVQYLKGNKQNCLVELAQCAAVIFRMADYVEETL